jgi:large subunit ribosomal protein L13
MNMKKKSANIITHKIDASDKILGRLACEIVSKLSGKDQATFQRHLDSGSVVIVSNAAKIKLSGKKIEQKVYYHHSGYPGGLKEKKIADIFDKNPAEILKRAVWNMLPKNKLRDQMIKRLKITN